MNPTHVEANRRRLRCDLPHLYGRGTLGYFGVQGLETRVILTGELAATKQQILEHALKYGLDFYDVHFELLDSESLNEVAAYGGFPTRYPHWRFGMQFEELLKGYTYGISKIYELVINNDPVIAYLMDSNDFVSQKLVMAHVYGHADFFKNNAWFSKTNRKMVDQMANHAARMRRYIDHYGQEKVEAFVDACLSLENLIDPMLPFTRQPVRREQNDLDDETARVEVTKLKSKDYMDRYINPPEILEQRRGELLKKKQQPPKFPEQPIKDVLWFLINYAPLRNWQRDVLAIVRDEAYYFAPQRQTKIMNEGWASYWHSTIMTQKAATAAEIVDFADHHSMTMGMQPGVINPYKLGLEMLRDIEYRWDHGMHGPQWDQCDDLAEKANWDKHTPGEGRRKIFEVRRIYNDLTFIDEFLTPDFCVRAKLFTYDFNESSGRYEISARDFDQIKQKLLTQLTNMGEPFIEVHDGNYHNRGELLLVHRHEGFDLDGKYTRETLSNLHRIWNRPVHLASREEGKDVVFSFDGRDFRKDGSK
ncbi:MAG: SpoVR family protein [Planctomycetes bacterium]|nr:SpoVR family protein [Planctomycetota bacterium]